MTHPPQTISSQSNNQMLFSSLAHANESRARLEAQLSNSAAAASVSKSDEMTNGKQLKELESSAEEGGGKRLAVNFGGGDGGEEGGVTLQQQQEKKEVQTNDAVAEKEAVGEEAETVAVAVAVDSQQSDKEHAVADLKGSAIVSTPLVTAEDCVCERKPTTEPDSLQKTESADEQSELPAEKENLVKEAVSTPQPLSTLKGQSLNYNETISNLQAQLLHRNKKISNLEAQFRHRGGQLVSKSNRITALEAELTKLRQIISEANERAEEMQTELTQAIKRADTAKELNNEQSETITMFRTEMEKLVQTLSDTEQSLSCSKIKATELEGQLKIVTEEKERAAEEVSSLQDNVKTLKGQMLKLEGDLVAAAANLELEQQLKDAREENNSLKKEVEDARAGAAIELERETGKLKKERDDALADLREADVREDALRNEISELRKRLQDADRRAEDNVEEEQEEDSSSGGGDDDNDGGPNNPINVDTSDDEDRDNDGGNDVSDDVGGGNMEIVPNDEDIRGGKGNYRNPGNLRYVEVIATYRDEYKAARIGSSRKSPIVHRVYRELKDEGRRFLKRAVKDLPSRRWVEMTEAEAIEKIEKSISN